MDQQILSSPAYQLVWPRELFAKEAARLLNERFVLSAEQWSGACELLLTDAFVAAQQRRGPLTAFQEIPTTRDSSDEAFSTSLTDQHLFLRDLMRDHEHLREDPPPARPLYRERSGQVPSSQRLTKAKAVERMIALIHELDQAGYFDGLFGVECLDTSREPGPADALSSRLQVEPFQWPMEADHFAGSVWTGGHDEGLFYDVVEYLHDHAARPRHSSWHQADWDQHCQHYYDYDVEGGQTVYRWRMNRILERSEIDLRLAGTGPDVGTLVSTPPDSGRAELLDALAARPDDKEHDADDVQRAISLFRNRSASRSDKRAAISLLYRALERRRYNVVRSALNGADSEPLYMIANKYDLRHNKADQHRDYPDYYLDWVFWMYLSTIELTNRIIDDQATAGVTP